MAPSNGPNNRIYSDAMAIRRAIEPLTRSQFTYIFTYLLAEANVRLRNGEHHQQQQQQWQWQWQQFVTVSLRPV